MTQPEIVPSWQATDSISYTDSIDPLEVLYNANHWRLNTVSPLNDFQYDVVKLKQYALKIRHSLVSSVSSTINYGVRIQPDRGLKFTEEDANAVVISINSVQERTGDTIVYSAILMSWGVSSKLDGALHLPYLLEKGEQKIGSAVKTALQTIFDCTIKQITFTQHQLLELGLTCLDLDTSPDLSQFVLNYKTPQSELKDKLTISFALRDMKLIWNGVKEEVSSPSERVNFGYKVIQNQIFHISPLDVSYLELCEVLLPRMEIKNNGVVKMKTPDIVNCVLDILNKVCYPNKSSLVDVSNER